MGEFGSGKSRCIMEAFRSLATEDESFPPIAINLRESYGAKKFSRLVGEHLDSLGLSEFSDSVVRSIRRGQQITLLDGFDEIGSQPWSGDANQLREVRKRSLEGVRDYIANCGKAGLLITGREHYFSSNDEMAECLGASLSEFLVLKAPDEFSAEELTKYLSENTNLRKIPDWVPRKPLICQLLARLSSEEVARLESTADGELEFFESVFDAICARETRLNPAIYKDSLKSVLLRLAQQTRQKYANSELITTEEINKIFFEVTGAAPIDEAAQLLQKLPYLGRTGDGGAMRVFVDNYAKDGLRGIALAQSIQRSDKEIARQQWVQPLEDLGLRMLTRATNLGSEVEKYAKNCGAQGNSQVICDYLAATILLKNGLIDFKNLYVTDGRISNLPIIDIQLKGLNLSGVEIGELTIEGGEFDSVQFTDCTIDTLKGVSDLSAFDEVFANCSVGKSEEASSSARISELNITDAHKTLLAILKKLFFQKGKARKEEALLRGAERYWDKAAASAAIQYMLRENIISEARGIDGKLFVPERAHARRMAYIMKMQANSKDALWLLLA